MHARVRPPSVAALELSLLRLLFYTHTHISERKNEKKCTVVTLGGLSSAINGEKDHEMTAVDGASFRSHIRCFSDRGQEHVMDIFFFFFPVIRSHTHTQGQASCRD